MDKIFLADKIIEQNNSKMNKKNFNQYKDETIKSLYEVECFLSKTKNTLNKIKLFKAIK